MMTFAVCSGAEAQDSGGTEPAWGLVITGGSFFITAYAGAVGVAFVDSVDPVSAVPLVGPWIAPEELPSEDGLLKGALGLWGAMQAAAAFLIIAGLLTRRTRRHREISLSPYASDDGAGVVVRGCL